MSLRILHVLADGDPMAAAPTRVVGTLAKRMDKGRFVHHAWFVGRGGPLERELEDAGAHVRVISWVNQTRDWRGLWRYHRLLQRETFDIIHQHCGRRSIRVATRMTCFTPIVLHIYGRAWESGDFSPQLQNTTGADHVITVSKAVADFVRRPATVVYPGFEIPDIPEPPFFDWRNVHGPTIGVAARLVAIKGVTYLVQALPLIRQSAPHARIEIAGDGPLLPALKKEVSELGLTDCVDFLGWCDLKECWPNWDIYCQPSLEDAFPFAAVEATAAGIPVIASNVGGLPELVVPGSTGWLVPAKDFVGLAQAILKLLLDTSLRLKMGSQARQRAISCFSAQRMASEIESVYCKLARSAERVTVSG